MINCLRCIVRKQSSSGCTAIRSVMNVRGAVYFVLSISCIKFGDFAVLDGTVRWCYIDNGSSLDGYLPYDAVNFACINCTGTFYLKDRDDLEHLKCCDNGTLSDKCSTDEKACGNSGYYRNSKECDGVKNCVNFGDETNCTQECKHTEYSCYNGNQYMNASHHQCITKDQVCDGQKDCISGIDESNCIYYGGRCDGFLCTRVEECVEITKVCDHKKDCFDGTDETMCPGSTVVHGFECNGTNGEIVSFTTNKICDGVANCKDKQDEHYCYRWSQWSRWPECQCDSQSSHAQTITRTRKCGTLQDGVDSTNKCEGNKDQEIKTCNCQAPSVSQAQVISYSIIGAILFILIACGIFICRASRRHKKAWLSYTQAVTFFRSSGNDVLIDPTRVELSQENPLQTFSERLPSTPPGEEKNPPILQFHRSSSYQDNNNQEDSILAPMEEDSGLQSITVPNILYHSYRGVSQDDHNHDYNRLTVLSNTTGYESYASSIHSSRENLISSDEEGDTNLTEQIQVARMGNLIEVSELKIT